MGYQAQYGFVGESDYLEENEHDRDDDARLFMWPSLQCVCHGSWFWLRWTPYFASCVVGDAGKLGTAFRSCLRVRSGHHHINR